MSFLSRAGAPDIVRYLETEQPPAEVGLQLNLSTPSVWQFLSGERNSWGQLRGYAIGPQGALSCDKLYLKKIRTCLNFLSNVTSSALPVIPDTP